MTSYRSVLFLHMWDISEELTKEMYDIITTKREGKDYILVAFANYLIEKENIYHTITNIKVITALPNLLEEEMRDLIGERVKIIISPMITAETLCNVNLIYDYL